MSKREIGESKLTLPQVKKALASVGEENLDQFQRRTFDYASKFAKATPEDAEKLLEVLVKEYGLDEDEAVQIVNSMPETVDELRIFLAGGRKIIETTKLQAIVELLNEKRASK
jgi:DNA-directed RNA polymerase subunit F